MKLREIFLAGCAAFYRLALKGIELTYRFGILRKVHRLPAKVVSVGNLTWGGTGKTPMVIHLAQTFHRQGRRVAVLTRGYGKDEADLLQKGLHPMPVLVGPDRVKKGQQAIGEFQADLLLLDDGYQQWRLVKDLEILMLDGERPFGNGFLIPRGTLREPPERASRADLIVVKEADSPLASRKSLEDQIRRFNPSAPIFFARVRPIRLTYWPSGESVQWERIKKEPIAALSGIAEPRSFEETLKGMGFSIPLKFRVRDHHPYTIGELIRMMSRCRRHGISRMVTTSKDACRIPKGFEEEARQILKKEELLVLHVDLEFEPDESELHHRIRSLLDR